MKRDKMPSSSVPHGPQSGSTKKKYFYPAPEVCTVSSLTLNKTLSRKKSKNLEIRICQNCPPIDSRTHSAVFSYMFALYHDRCASPHQCVAAFLLPAHCSDTRVVTPHGHTRQLCYSTPCSRVGSRRCRQSVWCGLCAIAASLAIHVLFAPTPSRRANKATRPELLCLSSQRAMVGTRHAPQSLTAIWDRDSCVSGKSTYVSDDTTTYTGMGNTVFAANFAGIALTV